MRPVALRRHSSLLTCFFKGFQVLEKFLVWERFLLAGSCMTTAGLWSKDWSEEAAALVSSMVLILTSSLGPDSAQTIRLFSATRGKNSPKYGELCSLTSPALIRSGGPPVKASGVSRPKASGNLAVRTENHCTTNPALSFTPKPASGSPGSWTSTRVPRSRPPSGKRGPGQRSGPAWDNPDLKQCWNVFLWNLEVILTPV